MDTSAALSLPKAVVFRKRLSTGFRDAGLGRLQGAGGYAEWCLLGQLRTSSGATKVDQLLPPQRFLCRLGSLLPDTAGRCRTTTNRSLQILSAFLVATPMKASQNRENGLRYDTSLHRLKRGSSVLNCPKACLCLADSGGRYVSRIADGWIRGLFITDSDPGSDRYVVRCTLMSRAKVRGEQAIVKNIKSWARLWLLRYRHGLPRTVRVDQPPGKNLR